MEETVQGKFHKLVYKILIDSYLFIQACFVVIMNQTVVPVIPIMVFFHIAKISGYDKNIREVHTFGENIFNIFICTVSYEILFYYSHRFMHTRLMFNRFHKRHHEFTIPVSYLTIYTHPLEHFLSNMLPIAAGPVLTRAPMSTIWIYAGLNIVVAILEHSNIDIPFIQDSIIHGVHHEKFKFNFGSSGWLDFLHDTLYCQPQDDGDKCR